jgi:hypothetical protein
VTEALSLPMEVEQPRRSFPGEVLSVTPGVNRVSRRAAYRGYYLEVCRAVDESGKPTKVDRLFRPTFKYDPGVFTQPRKQHP